MSVLQSNELDSIQELFELLQIKSDMWQSSSTEEAKTQSEDDRSWTPTENENSEPLLVKRETDDDEKEEGEIKDDDDDEDTVDSNTQEQITGSPNPVNLSLNTKNTDNDDKDNDYESNSEVSLLWYSLTSFNVVLFWIENGTKKSRHVENRPIYGENCSESTRAVAVPPSQNET